VSDEEQVRESAPRPRVGAPLGSRNAQKHGLDTLKLAAGKLGTRAIDGRTKLALMLRDLREKITADLGGKEQLSQAQQILIDDVARLTPWIDSIDGAAAGGALRGLRLWLVCCSGSSCACEA
jgi:hypothetical protein